ncbi:transporter substrate-binding domain-containing protein [Vibrio splendidus]|uniref:Solute-binding protein family 3/N-terminal domain-containing protein n=1 Tax=Vibrio echinoideorum TaxID=2100116 RepID=A0ABU9FLF7_9VIBR
MKLVWQAVVISMSFIFSIKVHAQIQANGDVDVLNVALMNEDRYPYFVKPKLGSPEKGVYIDLLNEIGEMTGIRFQYHFFPQSRVRHLMKYQKMDVEPGIAKEWRTELLELENSVYSIPLYRTSEVVIYRRSHFESPPNTLSAFKTLTSCSVLGFYDVNIGGSDKDSITENNSTKMLEMDRCDYMFMPLVIAEAKEINEQLIGITKPMKHFDLRIRLTKVNEGSLPKINEAIKFLRSQGYITQLFDKYKKLGES